ncbi:MAG: hypothetical protein P4L50_24475 [Anaerolineaceae bacterium]|nr:hypothetical protein [Anaerolineaceae bacterium]
MEQRRTFLFAGFIVLILICLGIAIDLRGFVVNMLTGTIEVIITIFFVDWLLKRQQIDRWKKIRSQIISSLSEHFWVISVEFTSNIVETPMEYAEMLGKGIEKPSSDALKAYQGIVKLMKKERNPKNTPEKCHMVYKLVKYHLDDIRYSLLPRVLELSYGEIEFASVLGELDDAHRRWMFEIVADRDVMAGDQWEAATNLMEKIANAYQYMIYHWDGPKQTISLPTQEYTSE